MYGIDPRAADHRPYPPPARRPWAMSMRWADLLFMHWRVEPDAVQRLLPEGLTVDTFDGDAWVGVIPFEMQRVLPRGLTWLGGCAGPGGVPGVSRFGELNVRTYARLTERPEIEAVWFFSLDASNPLAVAVARAAFSLNYLRAAMSLERHADGSVTYRSRRTHRGAGDARLDVTYRPAGDAIQPGRDPLANFLTGRYRLFAETPRGLRVGDIHHAPWRLRPAEADVRINTMAEPLGLALPAGEAVLHGAEPLDVVAWTLTRPGEAAAAGGVDAASRVAS